MYEFKPMHQHLDDGLGATGEAFKEAADRLSDSVISNQFLHANIPICYLYRHAIELYLKSMIVVVHRRLHLPWAGGKDAARPQLKIGDKLKFLDRLHSIGDLYAYLKHLVHEQKDRINTLGNQLTDWDSFPQELDTWIDTIESVDTRSTFFRYPTLEKISADYIKSDFQENSAQEILERVRSTGKPAKVYIEEEGKDSQTKVYAYVGDSLEELKAALTKTADLLSGAHFGFRMEVAGGH
jgi:hypothetical protein